MKPEVLDLRGADDPRDVVHRVVERLAQGGLVALPTETVYGVAANALIPGAVERLLELKGRDPTKPFALAIKSGEEARDWVPGMSPLGKRLVRRCWPGPVTLVFNETVGDGLVRQLPDAVRRSVYPSGTLGLRVPEHRALADCQRLLPGPLVLTSANRSGQTESVTADEVVRAIGDGIDMVLDDGPCRYGQPSTVVRVRGDRWEVLREGVFNAATIGRLARCMILFVCTGNTCRSPMAEAIAKSVLSRRLGCKPDELPGRGYEIVSAGVAAMSGDRASPEAVAAVREFGADLTDHSAQPVTVDTILEADHIFAMTSGHLRQIRSLVPAAVARARLIRRDGGEIADPVGHDLETYRRSAGEIEAAVRTIIADLVP